jgi:hypothetical protein
VSDRATQDRRLPGWWTLTRDILSFVGGWALIFSEAHRPDVRESVMVFAGVIIGVPGLAVGFTSLADALRRGGTGDSSSPSAPSPSASSSS